MLPLHLCTQALYIRACFCGKLPDDCARQTCSSDAVQPSLRLNLGPSLLQDRKANAESVPPEPVSMPRGLWTGQDNGQVRTGPRCSEARRGCHLPH